MKLIHILRPGKFVSSKGQAVEFSSENIEKIAHDYDPALFRSPIVVGHPKTNDPAFGWVKSLKSEGNKLIAEPEKVVPQFADLVQKGVYSKVSASLFPPDDPANPKPGDFYLKHVGFLGAAAPAIPGLDPVSFASDDRAICIEFAVEGDEPGGDSDLLAKKEEDLNKEQLALEAKRKELEDKEKALKAREKDIRRIEFSAFVGGLKKEGRVLPVFEDGLVQFMESIDGGEAIEFSADQKATPLDFFKDFLAKQPKAVEFSEFAGDSIPFPGNSSPAHIAEKAGKLKARLESEGVPISFADAVTRTIGGES